MKNAGGRTTGVTGNNPAFPARWFYGLLRALPGETGLVCHRLRKTQLRLTRGHRPLGRQDHTTSPSASCALVSCAISVHRISHRVRDDREAPPYRVRRADHTPSCTSDKAKYFCDGDLTRFAELPVGCFVAPAASGLPLRAVRMTHARPTPARSKCSGECSACERRAGRNIR